MPHVRSPPKTSKACGTCHQRKVRCDLSSTGNTHASCSNCRDAGVECKPHIRKRKRDRLSHNASAIVADTIGDGDTETEIETAVHAVEQGRPQRTVSRPTAASRIEEISFLNDQRGRSSENSTSPSKRTAQQKANHRKRQKSSHASHADAYEHECRPSREQQASFLGRSDYVSAHIAIDEGDATQYRSLGSATRVVQDLEACILSDLALVEPPQGMLRQTFIRNFMQRCRPWTPLIEESDLAKLDLKNVNCLLTTSMLVAGSVVSTAPQAIEVGHRCYQRAKVLFYTGAEKNDIRVVMATILLQWLNPSGPEHVSIDSSSFWLRLSVGLAHQLGLHREPNPRGADAGLRRRIWWTLVSRDNQIATSHGRPRALNSNDTNVRPLCIEDFTERDDDAHLFMHFVRITSILGDLTELCRRGTLSDNKRMHIEDSLLRWVNDVPAAFKLHHPLTGEPYSYKSKALQLHLPYFSALIILFRQKNSDQAPSTASLLAASFISGIFEEFLTWEDIAFLAPTSIFYLMIAALVQLSSHRFESLAESEAVEIEIIRLSLTELKKRFPTAVGAERVLNQVIKLSGDKPKSVRDTDLVLPIEQHHFFLPFGSKLCRKWSSVFENENMGLSRGGASQPPITPLSLSVPQPRAAYMANFDRDGQEQLPTDMGINTTWPIDNVQFDLSSDPLINPASLDVAGRWWWPDWISDLEVQSIGI
ncbi:uncharacterized protein A1O9_03649 [Exophiala aquamarina CBS 119918]|uniref:Zn(2)-C6 fungal-type domain-containing protein n=1 Tax=Exophiala aquamarina CBS 119918 TaxID=1182545 RepID=A0A072PG54_9EURO|nr:uncharacterized protein A1O9_03649 [Exophiala aquamarina CBS 119918]KEF58806.1 hypothetical protein A1O9_03649 [Exophiala aquamarina CBS 119918]